MIKYAHPLSIVLYEGHDSFTEEKKRMPYPIDCNIYFLRPNMIVLISNFGKIKVRSPSSK